MSEEEKLDKPTPLNELEDKKEENNIDNKNEIKEENEIEIKNEIKEENEDEEGEENENNDDNKRENEIKDDIEKIEIDPKEFEFNDQDEIKIEVDDDLKNIEKNSEKIEIDNLNKKLNTKDVLEKLTNIGFTKLELLSLNNLEINSLDFLNNFLNFVLSILKNFLV